MGIKHLKSFLIEEVTDGSSWISLKRECDRFQSKTGKRPTLVIDLMGMFYTVSDQHRIEEICGGRHDKYRQKLEHFLRNLSTYADLVFFEDGPKKSREENLDEVNRKMNESYNTSIRISEKIADGYALSYITETGFRDVVWDPTCLHMVEEAAKKYGKLIVAVTKDCYTELARYACNNPSTLAVVADDSHFLIFKSIWRYFSFENMNFAALTTIEYNKEALRDYLDLNHEQMKTLSTLAGNGIIRYDEVKDFHREIRCPEGASDKFPFLANFIKELPIKHDALVEAMALNIFRSPIKIWKSRVEDSLDHYKTSFDVEDHSVSNPTLHFCGERYFDFCYKILKGLPHSFSLDYYDMRHESTENYVKSTLDLFSKQVGILLHDKRGNSDEIQLAACAKLSHHSDYEKFNVVPVHSDREIPALLEFLNRQDHPEHDELRFSLLKWMVSEDLLAPHDLSVIPKNYLLDVLALCFMVNKGLVSVTEADLILYTIKTVELGLIPTDVVVPDVLNPRAFKLSFLFVKVVISMQRCFEVVGFKDSLMKIINFDGVFFHIAYLNHINSGFNPIDELADLEQFRLYK